MRQREQLHSKKYYLAKIKEAKAEAARAEQALARESWLLIAHGYEILIDFLADRKGSENKSSSRHQKLRK
jgi:hypothetical protein